MRHDIMDSKFDIIDSFLALKNYCEHENYKGWDPYDGLNSKIFNAIPGLNKSALCRLIMIQSFKRSPFNLRRLALIPKDYNAKGIGLFLSGYCNLYHIIRNHPDLANQLGDLSEITNKINYLSELLISLCSIGSYSGACWGYNFDWQARRLFLFPKYTPTVVATNFCVTALMDAYEVTLNRKYLDIALSSADFVIKDLHRTDYNGGFLFSYSPLKGNDTVFNASLLGSRLLSYCYKYSRNPDYKAIAEASVKACCSGQREDGGWVYGMLPVQSWLDSFHTGYNLEGLSVYQQFTGDKSYESYLKKGFEFYIKNFFMPDGTPKYYDNKIYPIDIHCPGQLFVTLSNLDEFDNYRNLADSVLKWTINNMQDKKNGFFYYQLRRGINSKIPYMRWSNAFMFNAMTHYMRCAL